MLSCHHVAHLCCAVWHDNDNVPKAARWKKFKDFSAPSEYEAYLKQVLKEGTTSNSTPPHCTRTHPPRHTYMLRYDPDGNPDVRECEEGRLWSVRAVEHRNTSVSSQMVRMCVMSWMF